MRESTDWGKHTVSNCSCILPLEYFWHLNCQKPFDRKMSPHHLCQQGGYYVPKYSVRSTSTFTSESPAAHSPQPSSWLFAGLSVEGVTYAIRSFKELLGSTQQNISVLCSNPIAALSAFHPKKYSISYISQPFSADHCSVFSLLFRSLPVSNTLVFKTVALSKANRSCRTFNMFEN